MEGFKFWMFNSLAIVHSTLNMKGDRARKRKSKFKKGHTINSERVPVPSSYKVSSFGKYVRLDKKTYDSTVVKSGALLNLVDERLRATDSRLLRPSQPLSTMVEQVNTGQQCSMLDETASVNLKKIEDLMNNVSIEHQMHSRNCKLSAFHICESIPWGLTRIVRVECRRCAFRSAPHKLYDEVESTKPGRKAAKMNVGLAVGLTSSNVGIGGRRKLLHAMNQPAPATLNIRNLIDHSYNLTVDVNQHDMSMGRKK